MSTFHVGQRIKSKDGHFSGYVSEVQELPSGQYIIAISGTRQMSFTSGEVEADKRPLPTFKVGQPVHLGSGPGVVVEVADGVATVESRFRSFYHRNTLPLWRLAAANAHQDDLQKAYLGKTGGGA